MKVGVLVPEKNGKKLIFRVEKPAEEKTLEELDNIVDSLIHLNCQRYLIKKSREPVKNAVVKKFY